MFLRWCEKRISQPSAVLCSNSFVDADVFSRRFRRTKKFDLQLHQRLEAVFVCPGARLAKTGGEACQA